MAKLRAFCIRFTDLLAGILLLILELSFWFQLDEIRTLQGLGDNIGPKFVPTLILIILFVLTALLIAGGIRKGLKTAAQPEEDRPAKQRQPFLDSLENNQTLRGGISLAGIFLFILLIRPLGFAIAAALYLFAEMALLAPRKKRNLLLFALLSIVGGAAIYYIFTHYIHVALPAGLLKNIL